MYLTGGIELKFSFMSQHDFPKQITNKQRKENCVTQADLDCVRERDSH